MIPPRRVVAFVLALVAGVIILAGSMAVMGVAPGAPYYTGYYGGMMEGTTE